MSTLKIPNLGENITDATIIAIHLSEGKSIQKDDIILELETDKATLEIPANEPGIIKKILVKEGDNVSQGQEIAELAEGKIQESIEKEQITPLQKVETQEIKKQVTSSNEEIILPDLGDGIKEVDVIKILIKKGQIIKTGDILLEAETDKATLEVPADKDGVVQEIFIKEGSKVKMGDKVALLAVTISSDSIPSFANKVVAEPINQNTKLMSSTNTINKKQVSVTQNKIDTKILSENKILVPTSPIVRRFAREVGVDITQVLGTLERGRISIEDVKNYIKQKSKGRDLQKTGNTTELLLPNFERWGSITRKDLNNINKVTAKSIVNIWQNVPHVTNFHEIDITELEKFQKKYKKIAEKKGVKITVTILLTKAIAVVLKKFPHFNASYDAVHQQLVVKNYIHIALAVDTPKGLLVPIIRDVDQKNIYTIAVNIANISQKAREGKLTIDEMQGQSFSISSLGAVGDVRHFTPIINYPDIAILGISRSNKRARYIDGELIARTILPVSLSYDHRVINGAQATSFMNYLTAILEEPFFPFGD